MLKVTETAKKRTALGQGLDALIPLEKPAGQSAPEAGIKYLAIDSLLPNPHQPRRSFPEESLADLSHSIKEMGVIQPLIGTVHYRREVRNSCRREALESRQEGWFLHHSGHSKKHIRCRIIGDSAHRESPARKPESS